MKRKLLLVGGAFGLFVTELFGQFGLPSVVYDPTQSVHAVQQIQQEIQQIAALRNQLQVLMNEYSQMQTNARYFSSKSAWQGFGNQIVRNWAPNTYGATATWNPAVLFGTGAPQAWQNVILSLQRNPYMVGITPGTNRDYAYAATVNTFDGAGPTAVQTLGNARQQQTQMAASIANLQAAVTNGSAGMNSEVQQLNLLSSGTVQSLEMQQTTNNVMTSLLEQQTIANKIQRDALADHLNFINKADQYMVSEGPMWGGAAEALATH